MWLLVLMLACGYQLATRLLREREPLCATVGGSALVTVLFLALVNALGRWVQVSSAAWWSLGILVVGTLGAIKLCPPPPRERLNLSPLGRVWLGVLLSFEFLFLNLIQNLWIDDDYWIHTPLQGLMAGSGVPPTHPFFGDIIMNGHYGRDLLIVSLCELTGGSVFTVQMALTTMLIMLATALLALSLRRHTNSNLAAILGTSYLLLGINVGGRAGLLDTFQNNNALVALYVVLLLHLFNQLWAAQADSQRWGYTIFGGVCLGNLAIVYETHFGLLLLVFVAGCLVLPRLRPGTARPARFPALLIALALLLAATQGGPISKLVQQKLSPQSSVSTLSPGEMNQRQVVPIQFPKEKLFQIQLGRGSYQRRSCAYDAYPWLKPLAPVSDETPYRPIWSWEVLQIHWLSTLMLALSLLVCFRERCTVGLSYLAFGLIAYLVPALVDFGPIYEFEYFRWEFAAGFGFATALGVTLGRVQGKARWPRVTGLVLLGLTLFNLYPFFALRPPMVMTDWWFRQYQPRMLLPLTSERWLRTHDIALGFYQADREAARYLREHSSPGQRALMSFPTHGKFSILCESTFVGLSGVRMVGHSLPLSTEIVGTPPFHMSAPARTFWSSRDPALLSHLGVEWLYLRWGPYFDKETRKAIESLDGVTLVGSFPKEEPKGHLYRVEIPPRELPRSDQPLEVELKYRLARPQPWLATSTAYQLELELRNRGHNTLPAGSWLEISYADSADPRERMVATLTESLEPGQRTVQSLWYATPHQVGAHRLTFWLEFEDSFHPVLASGPLLETQARGLRVLEQFSQAFQRLSIRLRKSSGARR